MVISPSICRADDSRVRFAQPVRARRFRPGGGRQRAVTLIEVLLSCAIFSMILVMVGTLFSCFTRVSASSGMMDGRSEALRALGRMSLEVQMAQAIVIPLPTATLPSPVLSLQRPNPNVEWLTAGSAATQQIDFSVDGKGSLLRVHTFPYPATSATTVTSDAIVDSVGFAVNWKSDGGLHISLSLLEGSTVTTLSTVAYRALNQ